MCLSCSPVALTRSSAQATLQSVHHPWVYSLALALALATRTRNSPLADTHIDFCARKGKQPLVQMSDLHATACQINWFRFPRRNPVGTHCLPLVDHERKSNTTRPTSRPSKSTTPRTSVINQSPSANLSNPRAQASLPPPKRAKNEK